MTTWILFAVWFLLGSYFIAYFILRKPRRALNLVWAMACSGWPMMAAREHHWLKGWPATLIVVAGVVVGMAGLTIVGIFEARQRHFLH